MRAAKKCLESADPDLALLDVNLPDGNGYDLCRLIRQGHPDTVIIYLTANDQESDQLRSYELGAVDHITKPFSIAARGAKFRPSFQCLRAADARIIYTSRQAALNGAPLSLSSLEYRPLELLCAHPRQVLTRGHILENL